MLLKKKNIRKLFRPAINLSLLVALTSIPMSLNAQTRDPFAPAGGVVKAIKNAVGAEATPTQALNPSTAYKLTSYKLVGVIVSEKGKLAVVKAMNGIDYILNQGDMLGSEGGKISQINIDNIKVKNSEDEVTLGVSNKIEVELDKAR